MDGYTEIAVQISTIDQILEYNTQQESSNWQTEQKESQEGLERHCVLLNIDENLDSKFSHVGVSFYSLCIIIVVLYAPKNDLNNNKCIAIAMFTTTRSVSSRSISNFSLQQPEGKQALGEI